MTEIRLENLTKVYDDAQGTETAVDHIDLTLGDGEFVSLVGPSGCGKSTTLQMLAGLEEVSDGRILFDGEDVTRQTPSERNVAMAFQNYALYPKMTARQNMGYGLKHAARMGREDREAKVQEIAELLDIVDVLDNRPGEMSGGQKQRVALGRAIVRDPAVFLLDEPLSNLDAKLRSRMRRELQRIHENLGITTLYVTHDQKEAMTMADRVAVMYDGHIQQVSEPDDAYENPANEFVAGFLGSPSMNRLRAHVHRDGERTSLTREGQTLVEAPGDVDVAGRDAVTLGVRPEDVDLVADPAAGTFAADVQNTEYQGNTNFVHLGFDGDSMTVRTSPEFSPTAGDRVGVRFDPAEVYLFDVDTGETLRSAGGRHGPGQTTPSA